MNLVGKIFTVAILIMSVAFMMIAVTVFATHRNWRDVVMASGGLKAQLEELSRTNRQLRAEYERKEDKLAIEQASRQFALASLQSRLLAAETMLQNREAQFRELQATHGTIVETLNTNGIALNAMTEEVAGLRNLLRDSHQARDDSFGKVVRLIDQLNAIEGQREALEESNLGLAGQVNRMQGVLDRHDLSEFTPIIDKPPKVDGVVLAVGRRNLIEISIGSDDGLREGHTLEVFRNNSYLGRIVVQNTKPDKSVGRILPAYRKGNIRRGDRVATKLT